MRERVVEDHLGSAEHLEPAHRDESRVSRTRADQPDLAVLHGRQRTKEPGRSTFRARVDGSCDVSYPVRCCVASTYTVGRRLTLGRAPRFRIAAEQHTP